MGKKITLTCLATLASIMLPTVNYAATKHHTKLWTSSEIAGPIGGSNYLNYFIEPQLRFTDNKYKFNQANIYLGGFYQYSDTMSFWLGIYRQYSQKASGATANQNRLWEQFNWHFYQLRQLSFSNRIRLEQRKSSESAAIANRLRERITLKAPFQHTNYIFILGNEFFLQLNRPDWVTNRFYSQNRLTIGFELLASKHITYEFGYLNQLQFRSPTEMSNIIYASINFDIQDDY